VQTGDDESTLPISFQGLIPDPADEGIPTILRTIGQRLRPLHSNVQWLEAVRKSPQRQDQQPSAPRKRIRSDGADAAAVLRTNQEALEEVSVWYEKHTQHRLELPDAPPSSYRVMLQNTNAASYSVDLCDTGEGLVQVLPVLTTITLARHSQQGGILAIEEPESHLHPSLQRALAEQICSLPAGKSSSRILLETHSENLLLGVQLEIVRGHVSPDDVLVYWVRQLDDGQSVADRVTFDRRARPQSNWPPGVFTDATDVAREVIRQRHGKVGG
jgi:predicted ATPase